MVALKKITAAVLAALLAASCVMTAGCGRKPDEGTDKFVAADEPWYSVKEVVVGERFKDDPEIEFMNATFAGITNNKMVFALNGQYFMPLGQEVDWSKLMFTYIEIYGKDGTYEKSLDVNKIVNDAKLFDLSDEEMQKYQEGYKKMTGDPNAVYKHDVSWTLDNGVKLEDGNAVLKVSSYIPNYSFTDYKSIAEELVIDLNSGKLLSHKECEAIKNGYTDKVYRYEGYIIESVQNYTMDSSSVILKVTDPEGKTSNIELNSLIKDVDVSYITGMMYLGEGKVLICIPGRDYSNLFYEMDLTKGTVTKYTKDISQIENEFWETTYVTGIGNVIVDSEGVKSVNIKENKIEKMLSFDETNLNRMACSFMQLLTIDGDTMYLSSPFIFQSQYYSSTANNPMYLYILNKEKTNPNAGKKVITVASLNNLSYATYDAICRYNDTNQEYFLKIDEKYNFDRRITSGELSFNDADYSKKSDKLMSDLSSQLMTDLVSGDGPDIVMDAASEPHYSSGEIFIDLKREIDTNGLFGNIVKASEKNGKIYNFPITVRIQGILANKSDAKSNQAGFTYEQYKEFVKGPCNGKDPINYGQLDYFNLCLSGITNEFVKDNKADFNNPRFKALAEYVSENVIDPVDESGALFIDPVESKSFKPVYETLLSFPYILYRYSDNISNLKVYGLPSDDGRGPDIFIASSAAVSVHSKEKTACIEFIKTLLSDEVQFDYSYRDGAVPVKKAAYEKKANEDVEKYNADYEKRKEAYTPAELIEFGYPWHPVDKSAVKDFETMIESCKTVSSSDSGISMIINEEMPAYFTGQKTLDQVITIINDRTRTYLNERS